MSIRIKSRNPLHTRPLAMLVTDLDGTLLDQHGQLSANNRQALERLEGYGVIRVVATGRSPYSFLKAVERDLPIDYAVLSSGVGIVDWPEQNTLRQAAFPTNDVIQAVHALSELGLDFMVHHAFPRNHRFCYWQSSPTNEDFHRRVNLYADHAAPLDLEHVDIQNAAQLIAIVDGALAESSLFQVCKRLPTCNIVRTTSPLDHNSTWIEIFPRGVSKSSASAWLAEQLDIPVSRVLAVGNDYNDLDLLSWAGQARVVRNAPPDLLAQFKPSTSNNESAVARAVEDWLPSFML